MDTIIPKNRVKPWERNCIRDNPTTEDYLRWLVETVRDEHDMTAADARLVVRRMFQDNIAILEILARRVALEVME